MEKGGKEVMGGGRKEEGGMEEEEEGKETRGGEEEKGGRRRGWGGEGRTGEKAGGRRGEGGKRGRGKGKRGERGEEAGGEREMEEEEEGKGGGLRNEKLSVPAGVRAASPLRSGKMGATGDMQRGEPVRVPENTNRLCSLVLGLAGPALWEVVARSALGPTERRDETKEKLPRLETTDVTRDTQRERRRGQRTASGHGITSRVACRAWRRGVRSVRRSRDGWLGTKYRAWEHWPQKASH